MLVNSFKNMIVSFFVLGGNFKNFDDSQRYSSFVVIYIPQFYACGIPAVDFLLRLVYFIRLIPFSSKGMQIKKTNSV